jgi:hypothetical protein
MLQFNKSKATNKNAVYLDTVNTGSGYYNSLLAVYSQSYDNSNGVFELTPLSVPNQYRNWLTFENTGSDVPTPSGQYDVAIYTGNIVDAIWGVFAPTWQATSDTWSEVAGGVTFGDLLYSDRAYVSGSNEVSITEYVSSNENGTYTTYNN